MDVPELRLKSRSPVIHALRTPAPGAYTSTAAPRFEKSLIASGPPHDAVDMVDDMVDDGPKESPKSSHPVLPTVIAAASPAGDVPLASSPEFPAAATTTTPASPTPAPPRRSPRSSVPHGHRDDLPSAGMS